MTIRRAENIMDEVCGACLKRRGQHFSDSGGIYCSGKNDKFRGMGIYCTKQGEIYYDLVNKKPNPNVSFKRKKALR